MKPVSTLLLFVLFAVSVYSQVNTDEQLAGTANEKTFEVPEGYMNCNPGVPLEKGCFVKLPSESRPVDEVVAGTKASNSPFACQPRPLRTLIVYDNKLLNQYDSVYLDSAIQSNAKHLVTTFYNSSLEHREVKVWILGWDIPSYATIFDIISMLAIPGDGKLDDLMSLKNDLLDADMATVVSIESASGYGAATQMTSSYFDEEGAYGVVNFTNIRLDAVTYAHECGHRLGCGHEGDKGNGVDFDAQAYINDSLKVHSAMKGANRLSREVEVFSGPNSWAVSQQGDTVHFWDGYRNNAKYAQLMLEAYWCDNEVTQVLIDTPLCGSGQLRAITNNADSFIWEVVSGNIELQAENDTLVDYLAHEKSVVRVIVQKTGKLYADTAYMTIPARQEVVVDTTMTRGDTLSDGTVVTESGIYVVTDLDENGCEVIYTYNIELSTSVTSFQDAGISLYPNPVGHQLQLKFPYNFQVYQYSISTMDGRVLVTASLQGSSIDTDQLLTGTYILQIYGDQDVYQTKFVKE